MSAYLNEELEIENVQDITFSFRSLQLSQQGLKEKLNRNSWILLENEIEVVENQLSDLRFVMIFDQEKY